MSRQTRAIGIACIGAVFLASALVASASEASVCGMTTPTASGAQRRWSGARTRAARSGILVASASEASVCNVTFAFHDLEMRSVAALLSEATPLSVRASSQARRLRFSFETRGKMTLPQALRAFEAALGRAGMVMRPCAHGYVIDLRPPVTSV